MMENKRGIEIAMNTIVYAVLALVVITIITIIFVNGAKPAGQLSQCEKVSVGQYTCMASGDSSKLCYQSGCPKAKPYCCPNPDSTST